MSVSEKVLFDTNILVYVQNKNSRFYKTALKWHQKVLKNELQTVLSPQNITEFFSIITNKKRVENPLSQKKALLEIRKYQSGLFDFIYPSQETLAILEKLIGKYKIKARKIFDAFLAATMLSNKIKNILTYNKKDFLYFKEIKVIDPSL